MKIPKEIICLLLISYSTPALSTTFNVCTKPNGERLIFNIPKEAINPDCTTKKNYMDYIYKKDYREMQTNNTASSSQNYSDNMKQVEKIFNDIKNKAGEMLDAEKALENLVERTNNKNDPVINYLKRETLLDDLIKELKE